MKPKPAEVKPKASEESRPTAVTNVKPGITDTKKTVVKEESEDSDSDGYSEFNDEEDQTTEKAPKIAPKADTGPTSVDTYLK